MSVRIVTFFTTLWFACVLPATAVTGESTADDTLAMVPVMPHAATAPAVAPPKPVLVETTRLTRVSGEVVAGTPEEGKSRSELCDLPNRSVIKTGKNSWCEVQFADVTVRCWQTTEVVVDSTHKMLHVKSGNVIVRKAGSADSKELLVVAGDRNTLVQTGIVKIDIDATSSRIQN